MSDHEINLATSQTFDLSTNFILPKTFYFDWVEILHTGVVLLSLIAFGVIFFGKLNDIQLDAYKSPLTRVVDGAISTAKAPFIFHFNN